MIDWIDSVNSLLSLDDIPDERITALVPAGIMDVSIQVGRNLAGSLEASEDSRWASAVAHFIASRLIISSRKLLMGQAFPDSNSLGNQWGEGSERSSDLLQLRQMADHFSQKALLICKDLLANWGEDAIRWYDV